MCRVLITRSPIKRTRKRSGSGHSETINAHPSKKKRSTASKLKTATRSPVLKWAGAAESFLIAFLERAPIAVAFSLAKLDVTRARLFQKKTWERQTINKTLLPLPGGIATAGQRALGNIVGIDWGRASKVKLSSGLPTRAFARDVKAVWCRARNKSHPQSCH